MSTGVSAVVIGGCLAVALWTVALAVLNRQLGTALIIGLAAVELAVLGQLGVALVEVIGGSRPASTVVFLTYAISEPLVLPAGALWSLAERSRSSTLVLTVALLAVSVMTVRMLQMWSTVHG